MFAKKCECNVKSALLIVASGNAGCHQSKYLPNLFPFKSLLALFHNLYIKSMLVYKIKLYH